MLIQQRNAFPRRFPPDAKRRGFIYAFRTFMILRALQQSQFFSNDEQRSIQESRLQHLFSHMYTRSFFWREYFQRFGFSPPFLGALENLDHLPCISKDEIRAQNLKDTLIQEEGETVHRVTTGTSGEPFHIYWSAQDYQNWTPYYLRAIPEELFPISIAQLQKRFTLLLGFTPEDWPAGHLAQAWETESLIPSQKYILYGNASYFKELADQNNCRIVSLALGMAGAEFLDDKNRQRIESRLNIPIRRYYGMRDGGWIAWECGHKDNAMHLNVERVILEIINNNRPVWDSPGEIVITILDSWRMPRIRYRTGDVGVLNTTPCPCGVTLPVIQFIGRTMDFLRLASGKIIPALHLQKIIWDFLLTAKQIQIKQRSLDTVDIYIVPQSNAKPPDSTQLIKLIKQLQELLQEKIAIEIKIVREVPEMIGGKRPFFVPLGHI